MFGTSGIRGIYGKEITPLLAQKIGYAFSYENVVVARDTRKTGTALLHGVVSGVLGNGKDILDIGTLPTPAVAYATMKYKRNGIMITASHNPVEYNGFKLMRKGREILGEDEEKVKKNMESIRCSKTSGIVEMDYGFKDEYIDFLLSLNGEDLSGLKVVVDCNGAAYKITPYLLSKAGCKVIGINCEGGEFNRPSEPRKENLVALKKAVVNYGADFGIAHDGDGDRMIIVDEKGEVLNPDVQLSIMIMNELEKKKGKIISTVESSLMIKDIVEKEGGELVITKVGSTNVGLALEKENAVFGGEPAGEYIYKKGVHVPDGPLAALRFAEITAGKGSIHKMASEFKPSPMKREKFKVERKEMERIMNELEIEGKRNTLDGLRIDHEDYWVLIRPSGTEPVIRITAEAKDKETLEKIYQKARKTIEG